MSISMKAKMPSSIWLLRLRRHVAALRRNNRGVAAVEFAMIIPLMGILLVGTNEFSAGVAVDRKVTLMARTLSDLTSQNTSVTDDKLTNFFNASAAIMMPYSPTPVQGTITELYINPDTLKARVQWSKGTEAHSPGDIIEIPAALKVGGTYLIYSEVKYKYVPSVAWFINKVNGITLSDVSYTRPRQGLCVMYGTSVCTTT
jgi:Flp pilus assembly protein TadG